MALTPAEKQRLYRERQRSKLIELGNVTETEIKAISIVDSLSIQSMDIDTRSYFIGRLIGQCCPQLKAHYVIAGLFDSLGNVTKHEVIDGENQ